MGKRCIGIRFLFISVLVIAVCFLSGCTIFQKQQSFAPQQQSIVIKNSTEEVEQNTLLYTDEKARSITGGSSDVTENSSDGKSSHQSANDQPNIDIGDALTGNSGTESNELPIDYSF